MLAAAAPAWTPAAVFRSGIRPDAAVARTDPAGESRHGVTIVAAPPRAPGIRRPDASGMRSRIDRKPPHHRAVRRPQAERQIGASRSVAPKVNAVNRLHL